MGFPINRTTFVCLAGCLLLLCAAAPAGAATASVSSGKLSVLDPAASGTGEANGIVITNSPGQLLVKDAGVNPNAGAGCAAGPSVDTVACPSALVNSIDVQVGRNDDRVELAADVTVGATIGGGSGEDTLIGGGGNDTITGGSPASEPDVMLGGPGNDTVDYSDHGSAVYVGIGDNPNAGASSVAVTLIDSSVVQVRKDDGKGCKDDPLVVNNCEQDGVGGDVENLNGGDGNDQLLGSTAINGLGGGKGDDVLRGRGGGDRLDGGLNSDELYGESGDDSLDGGAGNDYLDGGADADRLDGGIGKDEIGGGSGEDLLDYASRTASVTVAVTCIGLATLEACLPLDAVSGETGEHDTVDGTVEDVATGSGDDDISMGPASNVTFTADNVVDPGSGQDIVNTGNGFDCISYAGRSEPVDVTLDGVTNDGGASDSHHDLLLGVDCVIGGSGDDVLVGNNNPFNGNTLALGHNALYGGAGDDLLDGQGGADVLDGGSNPQGQPGDHDTVTYADRAIGLEVSLDGQPNDGEPSSGQLGTPEHVYPEGDNVTPDVEQVIGGSGDDRLTGSNGPDELHGGGGSDDLRGLGGYDKLFGDDGNDTAFDVGAGGGEAHGGAGNDLIQSTPGAPDLIHGDDGTDTVDYSQRLVPLNVSLGHDGTAGSADDGAAGEGDNVFDDVEIVKGGHSDDVLRGTGKPQQLIGGEGDDTLAGGLGDDLLRGDEGNDVATYDDHSQGVTASLGGSGGQPGESDQIDAGIERLAGSPAGDTLNGTDGSDQIDGGDGNDVIDGRGGNDDLNGSGGDDGLLGGEGDDLLRGSDGNDSFDGGGGADSLIGGSGIDTADYSGRGGALAISIDGAPNDGSAGEGDNVRLDTENAIGGSGPDRVSGSDGFNALSGGPGADRIDSRDGAADAVSCGPDRDTAAADAIDSVSGDCEVLVSATQARIAISSARLTVRRNGRARLSLRCQGTRKCDGSVQMKYRARKITSAGFSIPAGKSGQIKLKLKRTWVRRICKRKAGLTASVLVTSNSLPTTSKHVTLSCGKRR